MIDQSNFNYIDFLQTSATREYQASLLDTSIQTTGRMSYIFLLDKEATELDPLYNVEKRGRIYLPHFAQRALYKTNAWTGSLNLDIYTEKEEDLEFVFSFDRMVHNIRYLKDKITGKLSIINKRQSSIVITIEKNTFIIKVDDNVLFKENITDLETKHRNIKTFANWVTNNLNGIKFEYEGDNEIVSRIKTKAPLVIQKGKTREIDIQDFTYMNATDVIEMGAIILTDRYKAYEVLQARPSNDDYGGKWISWICKGNLLDASKFDSLPNDYRAIIERQQYNMPKISLESDIRKKW